MKVRSDSDDEIPVSLKPRDRTRYRILAEHGRGGLGRVYRAYDDELGRDVALKELIQPNYRSELRFIREARITARLEHPGIVPVHEAGRWPDGTPFYCMKLVAGRPLSALLAAAKTLDERLALLPHLIDVADAISYAHNRDVIHRDIKPSNVIVGDFGETIVIDWGLAKKLTDFTKESDSQGPYRTSLVPDVTATGGVVGTPAYMSPEQARGEIADTRSDVYSLGAILYQLCTGTAPPVSPYGIDLRQHLRRIPDDLATIVLKSLSPAPDDRYSDAAAFAADLRAYENGARIAARTYSLVAIFKLWLRHHKRLAASVTVPALIAAVMGALAVHEIVSQKNRATIAQHHAEVARAIAEKERLTAKHERDLAVRSEAAMLLDKDPTRARDLLIAHDRQSPEDALLLARAQGAPNAEHIIEFLPFKIYGSTLHDRRRTLAVSTSDGKLHVINLATGQVDAVDGKLLQPPLVLPEGDGFTYARHGRLEPELIRAGDHKSPLRLGSFLPSHYSAVSQDSLYLLGANGDLLLLPRVGDFRLIAKGIRRISPYADGVLGCTDKDLLQFVAGRDAVHMGTCFHREDGYPLATKRDGYVVQASPSRVVVQHREEHRELLLSEKNSFAISDSGLVVGSSGKGVTWYLKPTAMGEADGPVSDAVATALDADGALAAWGYEDGIARVRDTRTGATWTFVGHPAAIAWVYVSEQLSELVTVGGSEVRVWRIPRFSLRPIGNIGRGVFTVASSRDRKRLVFDRADGVINYVDRDHITDGVQELHKHGNLAFGVTWWGDAACSSGSDGKVICTDVNTRRTEVVAQHSGRIRYVHSNHEVLAYAVQDGGVWARKIGDAAPKLLYKHDAEPFRVAVNVRGDVASGANDGSVMAYDSGTGTFRVAQNSHTERVYQVIWREEKLLTSSYDGTVRLWGRDLSLRDVSRKTKPLSEFDLWSSGWVSSVGGTRLWLHSESTDIELDTGPLIRDVSVSTDSRFVGAIVGSDLLVYNPHKKSIAAMRIGIPYPSCVHFADTETLMVCASTGELLFTSAHSLSYVKFDVRGEHNEEVN